MLKRFLLLMIFLPAILFGQKGIDLKPEAFRIKLLEKENAQLVDIRTPREWEKGMLENAVGINFFDDFKVHIDSLDKTRPTFIYCQTGHRSPSAMRKMKRLGFQEVYNLDGGLRMWRKKGIGLDYTVPEETDE